MNKNFYELLSLEKNASKSEVRKAYLSMVKKHHPDVDPSMSTKDFDNIKKAYEVLSDSNLRAEYDRALLSGNTNNFENFSSTKFEQNTFSNSQAQFSNFDFEDPERIFRNLFSQFNDLSNFFSFSDAFNNRFDEFELRNSKSAFESEWFAFDDGKKRFEPVSIDLILSFDEACFGFEKIVNYRVNCLCKCSSYENFTKCQICNDLNYYQVEKNIKLKIDFCTANKSIEIQNSGNEYFINGELHKSSLLLSVKSPTEKKLSIHCFPKEKFSAISNVISLNNYDLKQTIEVEYAFVKNKQSIDALDFKGKIVTLLNKFVFSKGRYTFILPNKGVKTSKGMRGKYIFTLIVS